MPRLYRPHIPLKIRALVAEQQMQAATGCLPTDEFGVVLRDIPNVPAARRLEAALFHVARLANCEISALRLDHDPALENRMKRTVHKIIRGKLRQITLYSPDANDPRYLIYREHHAHHIKTTVRGEHGQFPDNTIAKRERRRLKKKTPAPNAKIAKTWNLHPCMSCGRVHAKGKCQRPKRKWASRPFNRRKKR